MAIGEDNGFALDLQLAPDGHGLFQRYDLTHKGQPSSEASSTGGKQKRPLPLRPLLY